MKWFFSIIKVVCFLLNVGMCIHMYIGIKELLITTSNIHYIFEIKD